LRFTVRLISGIACALVVSATSSAAFQEPGFEVVSIKPAPPRSEFEQFAQDMIWERHSAGFVPGHGRTVQLTGITLPQLIALAYRVRTAQVICPKGLAKLRFDIAALQPQRTSTDQTIEMLKGMLNERFALHARIETRTQSGLLLVVGPNGTNLKKADPTAKGSGGDMGSVLATKREPLPRGGRRFRSSHCTMAKLIDYLYLTLQVPVTDRTGLEGEYDVELDIAPPEDPAGLDRQSRIQEGLRMLGLDLKRGEVQINVVVVDSVSKTPTAN
jgi:uncharacterized protein (TIGR03435 family)